MSGDSWVERDRDKERERDRERERERARATARARARARARVSCRGIRYLLSSFALFPASLGRLLPSTHNL